MCSHNISVIVISVTVSAETQLELLPVLDFNKANPSIFMANTWSRLNGDLHNQIRYEQSPRTF